jgi:multidrug efflux pump subunit AcrA (membrane-fusion protein)
MSDQTHSQASPEQPRPQHAISGRKAAFWLVILLLVAVAVAVAGIIPRERDRKKLAESTQAASVPDVQVAAPVMGMPSQEIVLPGNIFAYVDSPIYARTNGYLTKWYFDIGAHVRKGQLLGVIASPEVDQQLLQARADLATAKANAGNAAIQARRYQDLLKQNAVSTQDRDNATGLDEYAGPIRSGQRAAAGATGRVRETLRAVHRRPYRP